MKKTYFILSILMSSSILLSGSRVYAASFNQNDIMGDSVFDNSSTMTSSQIDAFLNGFSNSCISSSHGFRAVDPAGYNPTDGFKYGGNVTAGKVIYDTAQAYNINPQVLIATLQKEESLVSGGSCSTLSYTSAVGYGCPDGGTSYNYSGVNLYTLNGQTVTSVSGTCVNHKQDVGFSQQLIHAAWLFTFDRHRAEGQVSWAVIKTDWDNSDDLSSCYYGYMTQGNYQRCPSGSASYYDGYATIDSTSVHMDDGVTAAFYDYTPHFSGNSNFYNIFTGWFGNTTGPFYYKSSEIAPPTQLEYGKTASIEFKVVNNSTQTWYSDGHTPAGVHPFRLMTLGYANTPFANTSDPSWLGTENQVRMVETSVAPGGIATFDFTVRAPQYSMSTNLIFILVQDGVQVHGDTLLEAATTSVPDYAYQIVSNNAPPGILPGDGYQIVIKLKNTGTETWYNDANASNPSNPSGHPIRLATSGYVNSPFAFPGLGVGWLTQNQITLVEPSVPPGGIGTFNAVIFAPYQQLTFAHNFRLVLDGVKFIGGPSVPATVSIPSPIASYSIVSRSGPSVMKSGQEATYQVIVKNTGNMIWRNIYRKVPSTATQKPLRDVRMMSWAPGYHTSYFWDTTSEWMGTHNQITPSTDIVGPGKEAIYNITFRAPPVTTTRYFNEQWTFVLDGQTVMPFQGLTFPITVTP